MASDSMRQSARCTARKAGWNLVAPLAGITEKGYATAGVGIAARSHFGAHGGSESSQWEGTVDYDATRIVHSHIGICCKGGIHCFSIYLHTVEGLTTRNCEILRALGRMTAAIRGPWIAMGDWNMAPEVLIQSGFIDELRGEVVHTR